MGIASGHCREFKSINQRNGLQTVATTDRLPILLHMLSPSSHKIRSTVRHLANHGVIAYPTEAVYGLGCDPESSQAVAAILKLKKRPAAKGFILIAAEFSQLTPYIDLSGIADLEAVLGSWPGPVTWLIKSNPGIPHWLRGEHETIAVRVTAHPIAAQLSRSFGRPLVSTSANPSGRLPARSGLKTRQYFSKSNVFLVPGSVGKERNPTKIIDAQTNRRIR